MRPLKLLIPALATIMMFTSCGNGASTGENPFFTEWDTPFGIPPFDKIKSEHFAPAFERAMSENLAEIDAITSNSDAPTFENVIVAYDKSGISLMRVWNVFGMLCGSDLDDTLMKVQGEVMPKIAAHSDAIMMNEKLFEKIKAVYDKRDDLNLDPVQSRLLQKTYDDFVRSGALLNDEQKARMKAINEELSSISVKYGNNILAENNNFRLELDKTDLTGIPAGVAQAAADKAKELGLENKYVFTLHKPSLLPFLTYSSRRDLREKLYKGYLNRCNNNDKFDNKQYVNDFIRLRTEKAHLLGYASYADYVVADQMSKSTSAVYSLLNEVYYPALNRAKEELSDMTPLLQADQPGATFESWDWWYYAEKVRKNKYNLDEEMLRPYFALENVQSGVFYLANRLWGLTFRPIEVPLYNKEATAYEVLDADGSHLAVLIMDYFPRASKSGGAWLGSYTEQYYKEGKRVAPVLAITCNFTRPSGSTPALLTLDETETLFHEFGHALHFMMHDVKYRGLTDVEGDFVELPSQIMENWATEPQMLAQYATHYSTGEAMPQHLVEKIRNSALFNQGFITTELVAASLSDMDIHSIKEYKPFDVEAFEKDALSKKRSLIPQIEPRYRYPYFSHIFDGGYSAGYYFYTWAAVLDKDAYQAFAETGDIFNREVAKRFRKEVLEQGGSRDGMTMYRNFRGAEPSKIPLLKARGIYTETGDMTAQK